MLNNRADKLHMPDGVEAAKMEQQRMDQEQQVCSIVRNVLPTKINVRYLLR